jgi:serine/threonine protein phosphatase PrpC
MRITRDHKGTDEDEIARIQAAGGFVVVGRVNGMCAWHRICCLCVTNQSLPYTTTRFILPQQAFLLLLVRSAIAP